MLRGVFMYGRAGPVGVRGKRWRMYIIKINCIHL